jgi:hypothetical protein
MRDPGFLFWKYSIQNSQMCSYFYKFAYTSADKMKARVLILFICYFFWGIASAHPIHISVTNFDIRNDSNRIDLTVQLFYEDFQSLINYKYKTLLDFTKRNRLTSKEQNAIKNYIGSTLILKDSLDNPIKIKFKGWKLEDMSVWLYFIAGLSPNVSSIKIENSLMLDLFTDQKNMLIADSGGQQLSFEFSKRNKFQLINIK